MKQRGYAEKSHQTGFTLLEAIVVIVAIIILLVIAVAHFS
jgi:type II secretory pathway pseudopilin PulG